MHSSIVIDGKKVATTNEIVKFEGEKSMNFLAQQFEGAKGNDGKDADYEAHYVRDAIVQISIKNPSKYVPESAAYELIGTFGGAQPTPKRNLPLDNTIHKTI